MGWTEEQVLGHWLDNDLVDVNDQWQICIPVPLMTSVIMMVSF
jgi:hypothetical protein